MIYYLIPILIGLLLSFYEVKLASLHKSPAFKSLFLLFTAIIFCGGYMTGSDWRNYELMFNEASIANFKYYTKEQGFYFLMLVFKKIGFGFFPFMILLKVLVFYIVEKFISKHFKSFYLPFTIFLSSAALFLLVDNPLRFMISFGIIVLSYKHLIKRNFLYYSVYVLLAFTFHISSFIMFFIYFIPNLKLNKSVITIVYFTLFFILTPTVIEPIIDIMPNFLSRVQGYYNLIKPEEYNPFILGKFIDAIFFLIVLNSKNIIINSFKNGEIVFALAISYFFLSLLGYIIPTIFRLKYLVMLFYILSMSSILLYRNRGKLFIRAFFISYFLFTTTRNIYTAWVYLPYSNYFVSLFQEEKSYNYRSNYNKIKFYERTGDWPGENNQ